MTAIPLDKIDSILKKGKNLEEQLGKENTSEKFVELSKEYSEIQPLYESVVEWKNMVLKYANALGSFTFQCQIFSNGNIVFAYRDVPANLSVLTKPNLVGEGDTKFGPVFVGISSQTLMSSATDGHKIKHLSYSIDM